MMIDSLLSHADSVGAPKAVGQYRILRVCPDPVAGEWFNVGVVFQSSSGQQYYRLLDNLNAFQCLFGSHAVSNLNNLLSVVEEAAQSGQLADLGPHIQTGVEHYAAGESPGEIMAEMFSTFVTLDRHNQEIEAPKEKAEGVSTIDLRNQVLGKVRSQFPGMYNRSIHGKPISLTDRLTDQKRLYDLPIFRQPQLGDGATRFASIVSAFVKTDMNRAYHLDRASLTLLNAREVLRESGRSEGGIFILRPHEKAIGFPEEVMRSIDDDIDATLFNFRHDKSFHCEVFDSPADLANHAINYAS